MHAPLLALALVTFVGPAAAPPPSPPEIRAAIQGGEYDRAIALAEKAATADPMSSEAQLWLGRALAEKARVSPLTKGYGLARKARKAWEKAVELDPANVAARSDLVEFHVRAPGFVGASMAEARRQADELLRRNPMRGHIAWGTIFEQQKDLAKAEAEYGKAVELETGDELRGHRALTFLLAGQKRYDEAKALWRARLSEEPGDVRARYMLARISLQSGQGLEEAVGHLTAYLSVPPKPDAPSWADAQWRLALVYERLGRSDEARLALEEALKLQPGHAGAKKDLERLRRI